MSFGFSPGDIRLEAVINNANLQRPRRRWGNPDQESRVALQPLSQAVGDFKKTLEECEKLLNDHERFRRNTAGFVDNVVWHVSTQRDVEILRGRVQFHATKLQIITKPFEIQLLLEIRQQLQDVQRDVSEIKGLLVSLLRNEEPTLDTLFAAQRIAFPAIPDEIADKFTIWLAMNPPDDFRDVSIEFNPGFDPRQRTPEETQFVNLLKSKWILDKMEQSSHLTSPSTAPLWKSALAEVKSDIIKEYRRFDTDQLVAPPKDVIVRLPDECFSIWVVEAPPLGPPDLAEQRPLEDRILELALPDDVGTRKSSLHVFRRSPVELRLVTTTRDSANPGYHKEKGKPFHCQLGYHSSDTRVHDPRWQHLCNDEDVWSLQQALTGYRVHHSMNDISWAINGSFGKPHKTGKAVLQMWQPQSLQSPTEPPDTLPLSPRPSNATATSPSSFSGSRASLAGSTNPSRRSTGMTTASTLFSGSSATSVMVGNRGNGTAVKTPEPPVLVFFTMHEGKYAFLHFELTDRVYVDPEKCHCRENSKKPCRTVVIVTKGTINLRRFSAASQESGKGLYTWDLARFRIPRHPQYNDVEVVKKVQFLTLDFATVEAKDEFRAELKSLEKVRNLDAKMCQDIIAEKQVKNHKPVKR
ncbi:MAG: hypothetical protein LQ337_007965 [Flavoplaca oasis]|nr:MAG: hypothetical protein LQ337_007965 [Flavoplaca oasis]